LREPLYDFATGGCRDALDEGGANRNEGAEATLSWLHALHLMHEFITDVTLVKKAGMAPQGRETPVATAEEAGEGSAGPEENAAAEADESADPEENPPTDGK